MDKIIEILDKVELATKDYQTRLKSFKEIMANRALSDDLIVPQQIQIKRQNQAYNLLTEYMSNLLISIEKFGNEMSEDERIMFLRNYNSGSLTNGKFYDYAVDYETWKQKQPDLHNLIKEKINEYSDLANNLRNEFKEYQKRK